MIRITTILLAGLLLLPFTATIAEAKATSSAPLVHVVKQGDSLYEISRRHGLTVNELKRLNGLSSNRLKLGQKLALNKAAAPPLPRVTKAAARKDKAVAHPDSKSVHVVKKGDSLYTIARRHGITVEQLKQVNNLNGNRLKIGQKLALSSQTDPESIARAEAPEPQRKRASVEQHVVKKGETLAAIARRHHMKVSELKRLNGLRTTKLKIGQRLALSDPYEERNPILLPGDASDDEVVEMASSSDSTLEKVAFNYLSIPYRFGGNSRRGIDCSAFVQQVFREMDVQLPRSAREQFRFGEEIERDQLQKGDLIFFRTYARFPSHVGIYLGEGKMIHASSRSRRVVVTSIDHPYYRKRFIGAKRISLLDEEETPSSQLQDEATASSEVEDVAAPVEVAEATTLDSGTDKPAAGDTFNAATVGAEPVGIREAVNARPKSAPPVN
ncbi:MAG: LysM peptidoglycan-binding domain-containing protein [Desulfuromonadales bacterium]|nr:LysM peptidoglycan-binding domain-containing protein [Desulfuromonadales bacterium]